MIRRSFTKTQLHKKCGIHPKQDVEFEAWFHKQDFINVCNMSEYAQWDTGGQEQNLWAKYQKGQAPWNLIMYCNNSEIVELGSICSRIDQWSNLLTESGQIYLALNKWCLKVENVDRSLSHLEFDTAILNYVQRRLTNFQVIEYRYAPNDRGGIGSWIHGNNRFWLRKI